MALGMTVARPTQPRGYTPEQYAALDASWRATPSDYTRSFTSNPRAGEGYNPASETYRAPGPTTQRYTYRRADGSDVMDSATWDPRTGQYQVTNSSTGPTALDRARQALQVFEGSGWASGGSIPPALPLPARVQGSTPWDSAAAEAAQFARAKDRVGKITRGALDTTADTMSARGLAGSGFEGTAIRDVVQSGQGELGEVVRDQAIRALERASQIEDRNYAGDVSQRGQDIGYNTSVNAHNRAGAELKRSMQSMLMQALLGGVY